MKTDMENGPTDENDILAETENLIAWRSREEVGYIYHLELGGVSLHMMPDEWEELVTLMASATRP